MKIVKRKHIQLGSIERAEAEILLPLIPNTEGFKYLRKQIEEELLTRYEYEIECQDCPHRFTIESKVRLSKEEIAKGGICALCSDDYK